MTRYLPRLAEQTVQTTLSSGKILILLGARQVGKTTMLTHVLTGKPSVIFLNLDVQVDKQRLLAAATLPPRDALMSLGNPHIVVIDEAQRLPEASQIVKGWYDSHTPARFILSGSSSLDLLDQSAESLMGRNVKIFLPPLTFTEILTSQSWYSPLFSAEKLSLFENQIASLVLFSLVYGSYPGVIISNDKAQYLTNLVSDYLLKDILQVGLVKNPDLIQKLLSLLAYQTGSLVSVSELANNLNTSRITVERYLHLLERTFIIFRLPAFSTNPRKEIVKSQKIFFWDTGIRNALIGELQINPLRSDIGQLWENWVIAEFAKRNLLAGNTNTLFFWRSQTGSEVDLVIKNSTTGELTAYESKWSPRKPTKAFSPHYQVPVATIHKNNFLRYLPL